MNPCVKVEDRRLRESSNSPEVTQHLVAEPDLESGLLDANSENLPPI